MATALDQTIEAIGTGPVALVTSDAHDIESAEQAAEDDGIVAGIATRWLGPKKDVHRMLVSVFECGLLVADGLTSFHHHIR
ncbi:MAG: hypothetical protein WCC50_15020 [Pseudolabrys sp.]